MFKKISSNEYYACDKCKKVPKEDYIMFQIQKRMRIFIYCFNCHFKYKDILTK